MALVLKTWLTQRLRHAAICSKKAADKPAMTEEPVDDVMARLSAAATALAADLRAVDVRALCARTRAELPALVRESDAASQLAINAGNTALEHPDYARLAGRLVLSRHNRDVRARFPDFQRACVALADAGVLVAGEVAALTPAQWAVYNAAVDAAEATALATTDLFSVRTLQQSYLLQLHGGGDGAGTGAAPPTRFAETPAAMYMRVALGIHGVADAAETTAAVLETFAALTQQRLSHATPTMFNAWTTSPQLASCFLMQVADDSIEGIYGTLRDCAVVSKFSGGIGLAAHALRARGAPVGPTRAGAAGGLVPALRVFSDAARHVDQGGGKRKGSVAVYVEPWHADIRDWLNLKRDLGGTEDTKARDLFYGLWVPDLFMRRVLADAPWSLFCPSVAPGLAAVAGDEFDGLYARYEAEGRAAATLPARELYELILATQMEVGTPYVLFKDACNRFSNQQHLGVIQCSNLCCEIVQYTAPGAADGTAPTNATAPPEVATCNLAAIVLDAFVKPAGAAGVGSPDTGSNVGTNVGSATLDPATGIDTDPDYTRGGTNACVYDFGALEATVRVAVRNVNRIIDRTLYPLPACRTSNLAHRPMGIGVIGLADAFARMGLSYGDAAAAALNRDIFETLYYAAVSESVAEAARAGAPHDSFAGSPFSRGELQFDLRGVTVTDARHDWSGLKAALRRTGARNSLLTALMPTATTAQIVCRNESFEPFGDLVGSRRVLAGDFMCVNRHMVRDLESAGLWTADVRAAVLAARGSLQQVPGVPPALKRRYRTVWEIPHRTVVDMDVGRQAFVDQSASNNVHMAEPTAAKLGSALVYAWQRGAKTGSYYVRRQPQAALAFARMAESAAAVASGSGEVVLQGNEETCESCAV
jgi:ribonucleoside-diphosphate reductase alpha subunit